METVTHWVLAGLRTEANDRSNAFLRQLLSSAFWVDLAAVVAGLEAQGVLNSELQRLRFTEQFHGCLIGRQVAERLGENVAFAFWTLASIHIWDDAPSDELEYAVTKLLEHQHSQLVFFGGTSCQPTIGWIPYKLLLAASKWMGTFPSAYELDEVFLLLDEDEAISDDQIANQKLSFVMLLCLCGDRDHKRTLAPLIPSNPITDLGCRVSVYTVWSNILIG